MITPVDCYKFCVYNVILMAILIKLYKKYPKNTIEKSQWNSECSSNSQEDKKKKTEIKNRTSRKKKPKKHT